MFIAGDLELDDVAGNGTRASMGPAMFIAGDLYKGTVTPNIVMGLQWGRRCSSPEI